MTAGAVIVVATMILVTICVFAITNIAVYWIIVARRRVASVLNVIIIIIVVVAVFVMIAHTNVVRRSCRRWFGVWPLFKRAQILIDSLQFLLGSLEVLFVRSANWLKIKPENWKLSHSFDRSYRNHFKTRSTHLCLRQIIGHFKRCLWYLLLDLFSQQQFMHIILLSIVQQILR